MKQEAYTLVTGGSTGIGKAIAEECARRKHNLLLVALPGPELEETAADLNNRFGVKILYYNLDLTDEQAINEFYTWCCNHEIGIDMLINNAGMGGVGCFDCSDPGVNQKMIRLNVEALMTLTHKFLPFLKEQPESYILNMSSMASLHPVPFKTVYAASKAFVYFFSQGLREELKDSSVSVSVTCPGPVSTSNEVLLRIQQQGYLARLPLLTPQEVARISINGLLKKKSFIVPGKINRMYAWVYRLFPDSFVRHLFARKMKV